VKGLWVGVRVLGKLRMVLSDTRGSRPDIG
jgi:hypothetical protein